MAKGFYKNLSIARKTAKAKDTIKHDAAEYLVALREVPRLDVWNDEGKEWIKQRDAKRDAKFAAAMAAAKVKKVVEAKQVNPTYQAHIKAYSKAKYEAFMANKVYQAHVLAYYNRPVEVVEVKQDKVEEKTEYMRKVERSTSDGVYIVRSGECYKIGITNDIDGRLYNLQTGNPVKLELMTYKKVANAAKVEKALHHKFSSDNVHGEWFTTSYAKIEEALNRMIETFNY